jgi:high-affinity nickel-transport protein
MAMAIVGLHVIGFSLLFGLGRSGHVGLTIGVGFTAYVLGLRHAFDADHVAAIDNSTRKLIGDGRRPVGVGFFFSLGHATVVFALACLLAFGSVAIGGEVGDDRSALHLITGLIGILVSGGFLLLLAVFNLVALLGLLQTLRSARESGRSGAQIEDAVPDTGGLMSRLYGRFASTIRVPCQMYPVGLLFGLGFDTATEVALLILAAEAAGGGIPQYAVLCLPILFAAGMVLMDTLNEILMRAVYDWAFDQPVRRIVFNLTITSLSIVTALTIGTIELVGLLAEELGLRDNPWAWIENADLTAIGFTIVGFFGFVWFAAVVAWRFGGGREERRRW